MADVQVNTSNPSEQRASSGPGTVLAIVLALIIGAALVWYFVGYRPSIPTTDAPANAGTTINVNVPPVTINTSSGSTSAPVPTAGANTGPGKPTTGTTP
jgi:hypothetical protein